MAAKYRRIDPRIWYDEKFSQLNPTAKLVALHILTSPESNRIGIFPFSVAAAAEHCGMTPETFAEGFANVRETFHWLYDPASRVVYIPTWWKYQRPDNVNGFIGCLKDLADVPKCGLLKYFMANDQYLPETFAERLANVRGNVSHQEQEQEQEQDKKSICGEKPVLPSLPSEDGAKPELPSLTEENFTRFWETYPARDGRKRGKQAARALFARLTPENQKQAISAAENYRSEEYIRDAERFLKAGYWKDFVSNGKPESRVVRGEEAEREFNAQMQKMRS